MYTTLGGQPLRFRVFCILGISVDCNAHLDADPHNLKDATIIRLCPSKYKNRFSRRPLSRRRLIYAPRDSLFCRIPHPPSLPFVQSSYLVFPFVCWPISGLVHLFSISIVRFISDLIVGSIEFVIPETLLVAAPRLTLFPS